MCEILFGRKTFPFAFFKEYFYFCSTSWDFYNDEMMFPKNVCFNCVDALYFIFQSLLI